MVTRSPEKSPQIELSESRLSGSLRLFKKQALERFLGAIQQDPEILSTHTDVSTNLVLVAFI
jgi:hypothetical protein